MVSLIAQSLDLNSLHDLSRTCRQFRANLLQYRRQLISQALRCEHEDSLPGQRLANNLPESHQDWNTFGPNGVRVSKITSGKVGACARDMVGECRKCSKVVCRVRNTGTGGKRPNSQSSADTILQNCIVKAPAPSALKGRHRRLCRTCIKSPLDEHTRHVPVDECPAADDSRFVKGDVSQYILKQCLISASNSRRSSASTDEDLVGQHVAVARDPCSCAEQVWICQPCGLQARTNDTTYMRGWTWRTRYSTYLGGLGTGIGEGVEGVQCGRHAACLAAKSVEKEIDCDPEELEVLKQLRVRAELNGRSYSGTSYLMQEMEGIGGVVKKKVKRRVRVGAVVKEYEDEREHDSYLSREQEGQNRSWCSWCDRVVLGKKDLEPAVDENGLRRTVSRSSSASSV